MADECLYIDLEIELIDAVDLELEDGCVIITQGGGMELLYYDIKFVSGNVYTSGYNLPDFSLYTTVSVNSSLRVFVDGIKYYWNENVQDFSDQIAIDGNEITFKEDVAGGRVEIEFYNNLVLK